MDSNRGDIGELRHEMQLGFARVDARFDRVDEQFKRVDDQFKRVDEQFSRVYGRFTGVDTQLAQVQSDLVKLIENGQTKMELLLEKALREQTRFFCLAWAVLLATIVGIYTR